MIYMHEGKGRWTVTTLWEAGFRGDWVQGMDMLMLEDQIGLEFIWEQRMYVAAGIPQGTTSGQYVIVMHKRDTFRKGSESTFPDDFEHIIYLPHDYAQKVRQISMQRGGSADDLRNTLQQR